MLFLILAKTVVCIREFDNFSNVKHGELQHKQLSLLEMSLLPLLLAAATATAAVTAGRHK
jgi:hypothetical protein